MCNIAECYSLPLPWNGHPGRPRLFHEYSHIIWKWDDKKTSSGTIGYTIEARYTVWANHRTAPLKEFIPPTSEHLIRKESAQFDLFG